MFAKKTDRQDAPEVSRAKRKQANMTELLFHVLVRSPDIITNSRFRERRKHQENANPVERRDPVDVYFFVLAPKRHLLCTIPNQDRQEYRKQPDPLFTSHPFLPTGRVARWAGRVAPAGVVPALRAASAVEVVHVGRGTGEAGRAFSHPGHGRAWSGSGSVHASVTEARCAPLRGLAREVVGWRWA
jgi:hypothetical protein